MMRLLLLALACLALAGPAPLPARAGEQAAEPDQILVMLRLPPPHYRGGSGYSGSYGGGIDQAARLRVARRIARDYGLELVTNWPMPLLGVDCFVMRAGRGESGEAASARVARDPGVLWSEPMRSYQARGSPGAENDPLFLTQPAASQWRLADLHRLATGRGITVAVIDSQIDAAHPDLAGQIAASENFVPGPAPAAETHGTAVAGIVAARAGNGLGIAGIAPDARLLALRACAQSPGGTRCDTLSLARALQYAVEHRAQVINLSLSGPRGTLLARLIDAARARGASVVAAWDAQAADGGFPASLPGVIAVSDHALSGAPRAVYTAPGTAIPTTEPGGRWYLVDGSSFAAAHVSGLIALMRQRRGSGAPQLVAARNDGGAIDAYASLSRGR